MDIYSLSGIISSQESGCGAISKNILQKSLTNKILQQYTVMVYYYVMIIYYLEGVTMVTQTTARKVQLSTTVRPELKALAEEIAKENNTTASGVVSQCLEELALRRKEALMVKYYEVMAQEHKDFAEMSADVIHEMASSWDD